MKLEKNFKKKVLSNGLTVLFEKRGVPVTSIAILVKQGGMHELEKERGIGHFLEHMVFKGTKKRTQLQISREIEGVGGEINAFTTESETVFHCKVPSIHTEVGLDVLTDIVTNSVFPKSEFEKEKKVIFEEIKMRDDTPSEYVFDKMLGFLYETPFGLDLLGTPKTLKAISREKLLGKYNRSYVPGNMVFSVVGDYDFEKIIGFCEKNFKNKKFKNKKVKIIPRKLERIERRKGVKQTNLALGFHSPKSGEEGFFECMVLNNLLVGGMSSRLFQEIREKRNLAYEVGGHHASRREYSYLLFNVGCKKSNLKKIKSLILEEIKKLSESLTEEEVEREKEALIGSHFIDMEKSDEVANELAMYENDGSAEDFYFYPESIRSVTVEGVKKIARKILDGGYSFFALVPFN